MKSSSASGLVKSSFWFTTILILLIFSMILSVRFGSVYIPTGGRFGFRSHIIYTGRASRRYHLFLDFVANTDSPHYFFRTLRNGTFSLRSCSPDYDKK